MDYAFGIVEPWSYERTLPSAHEESWNSFPVEAAKFILTSEPDQYYNGPFDVIKPEEVDDYLEFVDKEGVFLSGDPEDVVDAEIEGDLPEDKVFHLYPLEEHIDRYGAEVGPEEVLSAVGLGDYRVKSLDDILGYQ
jgi:hypothetical protein